MALTNPDHRMPQHIDVFEHLAKCSRENKCSVWGCHAHADVAREDRALEASLGFQPTFCMEHAKEFAIVNQELMERDIDAPI